MMLLSSGPSLVLSRGFVRSVYNKTERERIRDSSSSYENVLELCSRGVADQLDLRR